MSQAKEAIPAGTVGFARNQHNWSLHDACWSLLRPRETIIAATCILQRKQARNATNYHSELTIALIVAFFITAYAETNMNFMQPKERTLVSSMV